MHILIVLQRRIVLFTPLLLIGCLLAGCDLSGATDDAEGAEEAAPEVAAEVHTFAYRPGLDSLHIAQAIGRAEELDRLHALIVARHGEILLERRFRGPSLDTPVNVKSVSKSILSALIGIAIEEGILEGVDQPIAPFFEEYLSEDDDPRKREITIGNLLSMQSGLERTSGGNYGRWVSSSNWVRYALSREMEAAPGTRRNYSTGNTHLLSAILTEAAGEGTWSFARTRLAEPLGIRLPRWPTDPQGIYFGGNDMLISPRDLVRFGELYRNGGRHNGEQIVPERWVRASFRPRASSRWSGAGYGYGWFTDHIGGHPAFYGWGYGGQYVYIFPGLEMTVVATSDPYASGGRGHRRALQRILVEEIIPAAESGDQRLLMAAE